MKTKFILCVIAMGIPLLSFSQVGINSKANLGVFHIDPKANTSDDGTSGYEDDIIVTKEGRLGIGTVTPAAKLHIRTDGTASDPKPGLAIVDGSQGVSKVLLTHTTDGMASWGNVPGSWYGLLSDGKYNAGGTATQQYPVKFSSGALSQNIAGAAYDLQGGSITVPYDGLYRVLVTGKTSMTRTSAVSDAGNYIVMLDISIINNAGLTSVWTPHCMVSSLLNKPYVSFTRFREFKAKDKIQLTLKSVTVRYANQIEDVQVIIEFIQKI